VLNVVSGSGSNGIRITNLQAAPGQGIAITGNVIGSGVAGTQALGNGNDGILLDNVTNEVIGGTTGSARNLISANAQAGIEIEGSGSTANLIDENAIGTNFPGTAALGNLIGVDISGAPGNTIAFNQISGNATAQGAGIGVQIEGAGARGNQVIGNLIGTNRSGTVAVPNDLGVLISGAAGTVIELNVIASTTSASITGIGIEILGAGASNNLVQSNMIGTDATGARTLAAAKSGLGILVNGTPGNNTIGGTGPADGNVIAGFQVAIEVFAAQSQFNPTPGTTIEGNDIGTDITGEVALGNDVGIYINGVPRNRIGGTVPGAGNVISGNTIGIYLLGSTTTGNQIQGNLIGLDAAGKRPLGNYIGIFLDAASANTIGGTAPGARNFIAGNMPKGADGSTGVYVFNKAVNNLVANNSIGTTTAGRSGKGLGMGDYGVLLFNAPSNNVPRSGKTKNRIVGSGIAAFREFTGSTSSGKSKSAATTSVLLPQIERTPAGPRKFLHTVTRRRSP
jgi:hypothetical protein